MARFYATFDNTSVPAIEATDGNNFYQRLNMTSGATIRSALVASRDALSAAMYAELDAANKNGNLGVTVPTDGFTFNGSFLEGSNVYTNNQAIWQSDPRNAKTSVATVTTITVANSTAVTPADPFSIARSLYDNASVSVQNALNAIAAPAGFTGNGPYARLGLNPYRTLASIWTDHALTYIAWDDYTPGSPGTITPTKPGAQSRGLPLVLTLPWQNQFLADRAGNARVFARLDRTDGGGSEHYTMANNIFVPALTLFYDATVPAYQLPAGTYQLTYRVTFQDPTITAHLGDGVEYISAANFVELTP